MTDNPLPVTAEVELIDEIIHAYHTTRLSSVKAADHILAKPNVRALLDRHRLSVTGTVVDTLIDAVVEEAQQACRYLGKHNETSEASDYADGFQTACELLGTGPTIADHVKRHRARVLAALTEAGSDPVPEAGWIVGDSAGRKWRAWTELGPEWTEDRERATRYARRVDAEQVHAADEDAWRVEPYADNMHREKRVDDLVARFRNALDRIPFAKEAMASGYQFNAYESASNDDDAADNEREYQICIGPISDFRYLARVEGMALSELIEAALKLASLAAADVAKQG